MKKIFLILGFLGILFGSSNLVFAADTCAWTKAYSSLNGGNTTWSCPASNSVKNDDSKCSGAYPGSITNKYLCCCNTANATNVKQEEKPTVFEMADFQVEIPGMTKLADVVCQPGEECSIPWIGEYTKGIYNYLIAIVGVIAAIVLMAGGLLWLISRGEASKITQAKELIVGSITGVIILACSYLILLQLNPNLVNLQNINIKSVSPINVSVINKAEIQGCVGKWATNKITGAAMSAEVSLAVKKVAASSNIDPCYFYAILSQESGNDIDAFGDDRAVANCDIAARRKYICEIHKECCSKECTDPTCKKYVENSSLKPAKIVFDKSGNPTNLDLKYTYGFGLSQATYLSEAKTPSCTTNGKKGFTYFGVCYSFSDLLTKPEINLAAMANGTKKYYCSSASSGSVTKECFKRYAGSGAWAECTGGKKMKVYETCKQLGFDSISSKALNLTY